MRLATILLTIGLSLGLSGCWFGKKATAIPPPPAPQQKPAPPVLPPEQKPPEQKPLPMPPPSEIKEPAQITLPAPQKTPPPRPAPRKKPTPPAPPPPAPVEQPPVQPAPPPQLGEILSDAERRQYEADYAQSLARARSALQQASGKSLSPAQRETVERIKTFIQQAEESKGRDLATALQLVRRADVLGQDLLKDLP
jgi:type IV secretory pathway VirB10-like protein